MENRFLFGNQYLIKKVVLNTVFFVLMNISILLSYRLRLGNFDFFTDNGILALFASCNIALGLFLVFAKPYRHSIRYVNFEKLFIRITVMASCVSLGFLVSEFVFRIFVPRTIPFIFVFVYSSLCYLSIIWINNKVSAPTTLSTNGDCFILGSDEHAQIIYSLINKRMNVLSFVSEFEDNVKRIIYGIDVKTLDSVFIDKYSKGLVFVPESSQKSVENLQKRFPNVVFRVVTSETLLLKDYSAKDINIEHLIQRDIQTSSIDLYELKDKVVFVTGCGGSIGSELTKQLLQQDIKCLVGIDHSENALFSIEQSVSHKRFIPKLGTLLDVEFVNDLFAEYAPDFILHAAAYKHVPLCESNSSIAYNNNIVSTHNLLEASLRQKQCKFTLISSDKAVRPTNHMGRSKRICEVLTQVYTSKYGVNTSVVRFGNVINSSGSVIPTFLEQIRKGGPVTVTHPDVTRYFMTIPEAVSLVLQTLKIDSGTNVLVLDMGKPVKIAELAQRLIDIYAEDSIEIRFVGLRPGEKLSEELSISEKLEQCSVSKILVSDEALNKDDIDIDAFIGFVKGNKFNDAFNLINYG